MKDDHPVAARHRCRSMRAPTRSSSRTWRSASAGRATLIPRSTGPSRRSRSKRASSRRRASLRARLGVQWGFNGRQRRRSATRCRSRSRIRAARRPHRRGTGARQSAATRSATPSIWRAGASSAIGLALGSINGAFNLDVALSAIERRGRAGILSTPRVSTQNNIEAEITQGIQIPIQTVANNTVTVSFKRCGVDAARHAADHRGQHRDHAHRGGELVARLQPRGQRHPADRHAARPDAGAGEQRRDDRHRRHLREPRAGSQDRTPGLHRLPLLGWLFKRDEFTDESRELLIFITPKVMRL